MNRYDCLLLIGACHAAGCGLPEEDFRPEFQRVVCEYSIRCEGTWDTVESCLEERSPDLGGEVCDEYDRQTAADCIEEWEGVLSECSTTALDELPPVCEAVCGSSG